jgi:hypothetical protein
MKHLKCANIRCVSGYVPSDEAAYLSREVCIYCQLHRKDDRIAELESGVKAMSESQDKDIKDSEFLHERNDELDAENSKLDAGIEQLELSKVGAIARLVTEARAHFSTLQSLRAEVEVSRALTARLEYLDLIEELLPPGEAWDLSIDGPGLPGDDQGVSMRYVCFSGPCLYGFSCEIEAPTLIECLRKMVAHKRGREQ